MARFSITKPKFSRNKAVVSSFLRQQRLRRSIVSDTPVEYWTPAQITTSTWINPSDLTSVTEASGSISQILDKSGNNNHATQSIASSQPTLSTAINGKGTIQCAFDYMNLTNELMSVKSSFFITSRMTGSTTSTTFAPVFGESMTSGSYTLIRSNSDDYSISVDGLSVDTGHASVSGGSVIAGGNIDLGVSQAEKLAPIQWYCDFDTTIKVKVLAKFEGTGTYDLDGDLGEMIFLDFIPTTEIRQKIEGYLAWNWGLEDDLPALHPYKSEAPTL